MPEMTTKQRFLAALERRKPDRLPVTTHHVMPSYLSRFLPGMDNDRFFARFGLDPIHWISPTRPDESRGEYYDPGHTPGYLESPRIVSDRWRIIEEKIPDPVYATTRYRFITPKKTLTMVLQGNEHFAAASLLLGGDGLVPGMANFAPALFVALHRAATKGDAAECARLQERITDLCTLHTHGHWLPALKAACAMLGLGDGVPSPPLLPATLEQRRAIAAILARHGLLNAP